MTDTSSIQHLSDADFADLYNDVEQHPTVRSLCEVTGLAYKSVKDRARRMRRRYDGGDQGVPRLVSRRAYARSPVPLSESRAEFREEMTEQDCVDKIKSLQRRNPDQHITRVFFRAETNISDATWSRYFGTFAEFKRQAGIQLTRQQHAHERKIAKHNSVDHYRAFNARHDLGDRYQRDSAGPIMTIVGCSDLHDVSCDPFYLRVLKSAVEMVQPDVVNFGGDVFDLAEFGKFNVDPREWDVVGRIKHVHDEIFQPIREAAPDAQFDFVEGNHEFRLLRHLADATPALQSVLSDLHGFTVPKLLGLDRFEINYHSKADLAAFRECDVGKEIGKSYLTYNNQLLVHHHPHAGDWGLPGWNGHHHRFKATPKRSVLHRGGYNWLQLGAGHCLNASYAEGEFWTLGFIIAHINTATGSTNFEYVHVTDIACVGGRYFHREPSEMVGAYAA